MSQKTSAESAMDLDDENPDEMVGEEVEPDHRLDIESFAELRDEA